MLVCSFTSSQLQNLSLTTPILRWYSYSGGSIRMTSNSLSSSRKSKFARSHFKYLNAKWLCINNTIIAWLQTEIIRLKWLPVHVAKYVMAMATINCAWSSLRDYIGGVFVFSISSSLSLISSLSFGYSSNRLARPVVQNKRLLFWSELKIHICQGIPS